MNNIQQLQHIVSFICKCILVTCCVLFFVAISVMGLIYFDAITPQILKISDKLFISLYIKLKCATWVVFCIGVLFLMVDDTKSREHTKTLIMITVFVTIIVWMLMAVILFQPIPEEIV